MSAIEFALLSFSGMENITCFLTGYTYRITNQGGMLEI